MNLSLDGGFDVAVRLVDGHEDVVGIVLAEWSQVGEQVMQSGHGKRDACNLRSRVQCGFSHVEERVLHTHAVMRGKLLEQGGDDTSANLFEIRRTG